MAGPTTGASTGPLHVVGDLNDPEYLNWFKANRALNCVVDALRSVCVDEVNNFHTSLLHAHGPTECNASCTCINIKEPVKWKWSIYCPNNVCSNWLPDIVAERATPYTRLNLTNSTVSQWQSKPWQIAKIYMDPGKDIASVDPADTDAAGIIQLLLNFKRLRKVVDQKKVVKVNLYSFYSVFLFYFITLLLHIGVYMLFVVNILFLNP